MRPNSAYVAAVRVVGCMPAMRRRKPRWRVSAASRAIGPKHAVTHPPGLQQRHGGPRPAEPQPCASSCGARRHDRPPRHTQVRYVLRASSVVNQATGRRRMLACPPVAYRRLRAGTRARPAVARRRLIRRTTAVGDARRSWSRRTASSSTFANSCLPALPSPPSQAALGWRSFCCSSLPVCS